MKNKTVTLITLIKKADKKDVIAGSNKLIISYIELNHKDSIAKATEMYGEGYDIKSIDPVTIYVED